MEFNTALLHQQFDSDTQNGATIPPIYQVSAFAQSSAEQLEKVFNNKAAGFAYTRISNPTVDAFERCFYGKGHRSSGLFFWDGSCHNGIAEHFGSRR